MLQETEHTFDDHTYLIKQLPLGKSQEVLVRLLSLLGGDTTDANALMSLPSRLKVSDIDFLREKLLGEHCHMQNEAGNWVPMGKAIVESTFAGHIGSMFYLLGLCLMENFSSFLADLRLDSLAAKMGAGQE